MSSNPYKFTVKGVTFDFYDLSDAINFKQSAVEHAVKKLVALGERSGRKSYGQDLQEAITSLLRAQEQYESLRQRAGGARIEAPLHQHSGTDKVTRPADDNQRDTKRSSASSQANGSVTGSIEEDLAWFYQLLKDLK